MMTMYLVFATVVWYLPSLATACTVSVDGSLDLSNTGLTGLVDDNVFSPCSTDHSKIAEIDLSGNNITEVDPGTFLTFYNVKKIDLSYNGIQSINKTTFTSLTKVEELDISYNCLTTLEAGTFDLYHLKSLYLQNNNISIVEHGVVGDVNENLVYMNLNNNSLTTFDPWPFLTKTTDERRVERLFDIQHNSISQINNSFGWEYNLSYPFQIIVNLQYNKLKEIGVPTMRLFTPETDLNDLVTMFYSLNINGTHNPYLCDCQLYEMANIIQTGFLRWREVDSYIYRCYEPLPYQGEDWFHYLPLSVLVCNRTDGCPPGCFCEDRPHNDTFYINCDGAGLTEMPNTIPHHQRSKLELILDNNKIQSLKNVSYMEHIYNLSLYNNQLVQLGDNMVDSLSNISHLDLRNNRIADLPKEVQRFNYGKILLKGNPLRCDCDSTWMSEWLKLYQNDGDISITCTSEEGEFKVIDLTLDELGCTYRDLIIIFVCVGLVVAAGVAIFSFSRVCPYETKVIFHKLLGAHPRDKYVVDDDESKQLDIYLIFDWDDEDVRGWIRYFQEKLQRKKKPLYSILNPCRFSEGGAESKTYTKWISKCRRVVIVLSKEIFKRKWQPAMIDLAENNLAEAQARQNADGDPCNSETDLSAVDKTLETAAKIIYVVYNNDEDLENKLNQEPWKSRLSGKPVLTTGQRMFWSKLRYELPQTGNGKGKDGNFVPPPEYVHRNNVIPVVGNDAAVGLRVEDETRNLPKNQKQGHGGKKITEVITNKSKDNPKPVIKDSSRYDKELHFSRHARGTQAKTVDIANGLKMNSENDTSSRIGLFNVNVPGCARTNLNQSGENLLNALKTPVNGTRLNVVSARVHTSARDGPDIHKTEELRSPSEREKSCARSEKLVVKADVHNYFQSGPVNQHFFAKSNALRNVNLLYSRGGGAEGSDVNESLTDLSEA